MLDFAGQLQTKHMMWLKQQVKLQGTRSIQQHGWIRRHTHTHRAETAELLALSHSWELEKCLSPQSNEEITSTALY